jgi:biopolymer transport protein ExbD
MDVGGPRGAIKADINVTPLVDVMLVLLIIMMLVAPLIQQGVSVRLPQAQHTTEKPETQDQAVIAISAGKEIYLNAQPIARGELMNRLTESLKDKKDKIVLIKADKDVDYGTVMQAMDDLRLGGIEDIGLITDPKQDPNAPRGGK